MNVNLPWLRFAVAADDDLKGAAPKGVSTTGGSGDGDEDGANSSKGAGSDDDDDGSTDGENDSSGTDWKAMSRKWEKRAKDNKREAEANRQAREELDRLQDEKKTEIQREREGRERAEQELEQLRVTSLRYKVAAAHNLSAEDADLFLKATTEEEMTEQAKRLFELSAASASAERTGRVPGKQRERQSPKPDANSGEELYKQLNNNGSY